MKILISLFSLLLYTACLQETSADEPHVGLWELEIWTATDEDGETAYPYGEDALGRLHYLSNGQMTFTLTADNRPKFGTFDHTSIDPQLVLDAFDNYFTYFGTYSIDYDQGVVTHHIEGCLFPDWVGMDQERHFQLVEEKLVLKAYNKFGRDHVLVWVKVEG